MAPLTKALSVRRKPDPAVTALGVVTPPPIHVESPRFSGSLATLFQCVRDRKIDLRDVPLAPVCEAYFEYLRANFGADFDGAGAALEALSYLVERKAWLLLPSLEAEPEMEEPALLIEPSTHLFEEAIDSLRERRLLRERMHFRVPEPDPDPYLPPAEERPITVGDLARVFERLLAKAVPESFEPPAQPRRSLSDHMRVVLSALTHEPRTLDELVTPPFTRTEAVWWFLALLELIRLDQAVVAWRNDDVVFARRPRGPKEATTAG